MKLTQHLFFRNLLFKFLTEIQHRGPGYIRPELLQALSKQPCFSVNRPSHYYFKPVLINDDCRSEPLDTDVIFSQRLKIQVFKLAEYNYFWGIAIPVSLRTLSRFTKKIEIPHATLWRRPWSSTRSEKMSKYVTTIYLKYPPRG